MVKKRLLTGTACALSCALMLAVPSGNAALAASSQTCSTSYSVRATASGIYIVCPVAKTGASVSNICNTTAKQTGSSAAATAKPPVCPPTATAKPTATVKPTATPAPTPTPTPSSDNYTQEACSTQAQQMLNLVNSERNKNGRSALALDPELCRIALAKSQDMVAKKYFSHTSPTYGSISNMLKTFGYSFTSAGENIAQHSTVEKSHAAFMSSPGHRQNILSSSWKKVGIGIVQNNGYVTVTQIFVR